MPRSSAKPRSVLSPRTNVLDLSTPQRKSSATLPTPPDSKSKRRRTGAAGAPKVAKKRKVAAEPGTQEESEESDIDEVEEEFSLSPTLKTCFASKPHWSLPLRNLAAIPGLFNSSSRSCSTKLV